MQPDYSLRRWRWISKIAYMSVLVMVVVVVDIYDGFLTVGMSVLMMAAVVVDMHDGSVDTVD